MRCIPLMSLLSLFLLSASDWSLADLHTEFAIDLYKKIANANYGKNVFFSSLSVSTAFGMVHLGARSKTKAQLKDGLKLNALNSDNAVNDEFEKLLTGLKQQDNNFTLHLANKLFGSKEFNFRQQFLDDSQKYFQSTLEALDFKEKSEESRLRINNWVSEQTQGKIKDLLSAGSIDPITKLVIVNAIYFKASWKFQFHPQLTKSGNFSVSNSETVRMDMMQSTDEFLNHYESQELDCSILELPYEGDQASMFIILPRSIEGLPRLESRLTKDSLANELLGKVRGTPVIVTLPKFRLDQSIPLKQFLQTLGMTDVFDSKKSDLSGISESGGLYASDAAHKAFINVDEYGTEAAAATGVIIKPASAPVNPVRFTVDKPFLFLITAKKTNTILFLGRLVRDTQQNEVIGRFGQSAYLTGSAQHSSVNFLVIWSTLMVIVSLFCMQ